MSVVIGIARLASEGQLLEAKRAVDYRTLPTRGVLNRCSSAKAPFSWTINPYRGCEYGCKYCYARYIHEFMELRESADFENRIFAKQFTLDTFRRDLARVKQGEGIGIGTATDPYQPAERRYGLTRRILRALADTSGHKIFITTESDLVARDVDLLAELHARHWLHVGMTITTLDNDLARALEPRAPRPELRLEAVRTLARAGVRAGVQCSPVMPHINDQEIESIARAAVSAGATSFFAQPLFLMPCALRVFLLFLAEHFPHLHRKYEQHFSREAYLRGDYAERLAQRVRAARVKVGLPERYERTEGIPAPPQLALPF
ncbi:MAG: radical SAM protein [Acidobacteriota bacterium]